MSRGVVLELLQALKLKSPLPDTNLILLVQVGLCLIYNTLHEIHSTFRKFKEGRGNMHKLNVSAQK